MRAFGSHLSLDTSNKIATKFIDKENKKCLG
nr:MAG TPA: hypothetical protein [Caudoviricetes sp.]